MIKALKSYWNRVIKGKGTVAESWPTAEELWNDPEVRKSIEKHNREQENEKWTKN